MKNHHLQKPFAFLLLLFFFFGNVGFVSGAGGYLALEQRNLKNAISNYRFEIKRIEVSNEYDAITKESLVAGLSLKIEGAQRDLSRVNVKQMKQRFEENNSRKELESRCEDSGAGSSSCNALSQDFEKCYTAESYEEGACASIANILSSKRIFSGDEEGDERNSFGNFNGVFNKTKIDLFAPFAKTGKDVFCRVPKYEKADCPSGFINGDGDGSFCYKRYNGTSCTYTSANSKKTIEGAVVQRIISTASPENLTMDLFNRYVGMVFVYGLGLGAGFSVLMIVVGGIQTIVTGSSPESVSAGKDRILQGVVGIGLLILAASILYTVNPLFFTIK
ncbi:hypothetical protein HON22_02625 [Candidatus Peregrinibacteria bacterium]|nr:hypothetical protein [Candidatus Peregrinibacteria bacterium]